MKRVAIVGLVVTIAMGGVSWGATTTGDDAKAKQAQADQLAAEAKQLEAQAQAKRKEAEEAKKQADALLSEAKNTGGGDSGVKPPTRPDQKNFLPPLFLHTGLRILNPYVINTETNGGKRFFIDPDKSEVTGFIEVQMATRWAERMARNFSTNTATEAGWNLLGNVGGKQNDSITGLSLDADIRGGVNFTGSGDSAATIVGTGSTYAEATVGFPILRQVMAAPAGELPVLHSLNLELNGGFNVSRKISEVHPSAGIGLATIWSVPLFKSQRSALIVGRGGVGWIDAPNLVESTTDRLEVVNNRGVPDFEVVRSYSAVFEARIPVGELAWFTFGARFHNSKADPDVWTMSLAYTLPLDELLGRVTDLWSPRATAK